MPSGLVALCGTCKCPVLILFPAVSLEPISFSTIPSPAFFRFVLVGPILIVIKAQWALQEAERQREVQQRAAKELERLTAEEKAKKEKAEEEARAYKIYLEECRQQQAEERKMKTDEETLAAKASAARSFNEYVRDPSPPFTWTFLACALRTLPLPLPGSVLTEPPRTKTPTSSRICQRSWF